MPELIKLDEQNTEIKVNVAMVGFNEDGCYRPDSYARIMGEVVEEHLAKVHMAIPDMMEQFNISWALLSEHFYINRHPKMGETLTVKTWCSGKKSMLYGRDVIFYDEAGEVVFGVGNTSALYDLENRTMLKSGPIYDQFQFEVGEQVYKDKVKMSLRGYDLEPIESFIVQPGHLDSLGHMNNTRYGEVLYNAVTEEARKKLPKMKELELHFQQELSLGEEMLMRRFESEEEAVIVGYKKNEDGSQGHLAFSGRMIFHV